MRASGWAREMLVGPETVDDISGRVAHAFGIGKAELFGDNRTRMVTLARHVAYYLAYQRTGLSYKELGRFFRRDHTTILTGSRKVQRKMLLDEAFQKVVSELLDTPCEPVSATSDIFLIHGGPQGEKVNRQAG